MLSFRNYYGQLGFHLYLGSAQHILDDPLAVLVISGSVSIFPSGHLFDFRRFPSHWHASRPLLVQPLQEGFAGPPLVVIVDGVGDSQLRRDPQGQFKSSEETFLRDLIQLFALQVRQF